MGKRCFEIEQIKRNSLWEICRRHYLLIAIKRNPLRGILRRSFLLILLSLLLVGNSKAQINSYSNRPKVGVVLSGGGAKGVAHISALRAIEQAGIPIDYICGTSMGSLIGGLYAIGWTTDELDSLVRAQDWSILLTDKVAPSLLDLESRRRQNTYLLRYTFLPGSKSNEGAGFIRGDNLDRLFTELLAGYLDSISFDSLPIPFACVATDIITNREVDFRSGYLKQAMRASMSIPGVFSPVRMGNKLLVDGGMRNNYPADIARQMGADIIIGVTVQDDTLTADDITGPVELLMQIIDINCKNKYQANLDMSDLVIKVDVHGYSAASFTAAAIDTLLRRGAEAAASHEEELRRIAGSIPQVAGSRHQVVTHHSSLITPHSSFITPHSPTSVPHPVVGVAFRFDNEEAGAFQIGATMPFKWHLPMSLSTRFRMGKRILFRLEHRLYPQGITSPSLAYDFYRNDIDVYSHGTRAYNIKYRQHRVELLPINLHFRRYRLHAGLRFDYFHYTDPLLSAIPTTVTLENDHYFSYFLSADLNTEDHWYFPSSGTRLHLAYAYRTTDLLTLHGEPGLNDITVHWRINIPLDQRLTLQPLFYGRILTSGEPPLVYSNIAGGEWFGHFVEQQLPFAGLGHVELLHRHFAAAQLQVQYRMGKNHYLLLRAAAAYNTDDLSTVSPNPDFYGLQLGYSYNSFIGPLSVRLGYTTLSDKPYFLLNAGHKF